MARTKVIAGVAAAALLLGGVLGVRGGTAVEQAALDEAAPAPVPSEPDDVRNELLLDANGLPGLRLGTSGRTMVAPLDEAQEPGACQLGWGVGLGERYDVHDLAEEWETNAWVVDGTVVGVVLNRWSDEQQASQVLRTWLGPTLGSPLTAAQELPGARTVRHATFDGRGPTVSVVTVPLDGVEVVFGDAPSWLGPGDPAQSSGVTRITSIELRRPAARTCSMADVWATGSGGTEVLDADGLGPVRLGGPVEPLLADGVLEEQTGGGSAEQPRCRSFYAPTVDLQVTSLDDVVVSVQAFGVQRTSFGLRAGDGVDEVRAAFPEVGRSAVTGLGALDVEVDGHVVRLEMHEGHKFVPDLERVVFGGPRVVQAITVLTPQAAREGVGC